MNRLLFPVAAAILVACLVFPLLWTLVASLTPEAQLFDDAILPGSLSLEHYAALWRERDFTTPILNSLIVCTVTTMLCLVLGSLCAYALARLHVRGRSIILALILAVGMFPQISIVSPLYLLLRSLGLIDTRPGLVLPYLTFAMPLAVWMLAGFLRQLPPELEEAALVDGAGRFTILWRVMLPLAAPGLAATGILVFLYCWNEFLFALSFTVSPQRHTVPVAIAMFRSQYQVPWGQVLAATIVATVPVVTLVLFVQRSIVRGLTAGAVKG